MKNAFVIPFMLALAAPAFAQSDGFDFKGVPLGSSVEALRSKYPEYYCRTTLGSPLGDTTCNLSEEEKCLLEEGAYADNRSCREAVIKAKTYAGVRAEISLMFYEDRLSMARATFAPDGFSNVVTAIREKYGKPSSKRTEPVTNRVGATFENQILEWKKAGTTIQAEKYATRLDRSAVKVFSDSYFAEFEKRKGAKAKQGAKDL